MKLGVHVVMRQFSLVFHELRLLLVHNKNYVSANINIKSRDCLNLSKAYKILTEHYRLTRKVDFLFLLACGADACALPFNL